MAKQKVSPLVTMKLSARLLNKATTGLERRVSNKFPMKLFEVLFIFL